MLGAQGSGEMHEIGVARFDPGDPFVDTPELAQAFVEPELG